MDKLLVNKFEAVLPSGMEGCFTQTPRGVDVLFQEELKLIVHSSLKRQEDFSSGRWCAHFSVKKLKKAPFPILREERFLNTSLQKMPKWPLPWKGSISHTEGLWGAAVTHENSILGMGIDVEKWKKKAFEGEDGFSVRLANKVTSKEELHALMNLPLGLRQKALAVLFSAKEALYKCLCNLTVQNTHRVDLKQQHNIQNVQLNWNQVQVISRDAFSTGQDGAVLKACIDPGAPSYILPSERLYGRYLIEGEYVFTLFWVEKVSDDKI